MFVALLFPNIEVIEVGVSNFVTVDYASFSSPGVFFCTYFYSKEQKIVRYYYYGMYYDDFHQASTFFLRRRGHELK